MAVRLTPSFVSGAVYCAAVLVMGLRAGQPLELWWWIGGLPFMAWVASPIFCGFWIANILSSRAVNVIYFLLIAVIGTLGYAEQWYVMFVGPSDAQNALILVFVPFLQWVAVGAAFVLAWVADRYVFKS